MNSSLIPLATWDELIRSNRKTLGITVRPDKSVLIRAPIGAKVEQIEEIVRKRLKWIKRQQSYFEKFDPRSSERRYVSGEGHLFLGRRYRLKVIVGEKPKVRLNAGYIEVHVGDNASVDEVRRRLNDWYRQQARQHFESIVRHSIEHHFPNMEVSDIRVQRMKKRWGSCNQASSISLNLDLIRAPKSCIEYVVVHELCHFRIPNHSRRFYRLLEGVLPDWNSRKDRLERMLA